MKSNLKKAFIDQLLLGFFLLTGIVVFIATSSDETKTRNKLYDLKTITRDAARTAGKYYLTDQDITNAETISVNIISQMKLGDELIGDGSNSSTNGTTTTYTNPDGSGNSLTYEWDLASNPKSLTVSIAPYEDETFWYRFLNLFNFILNASHKINIISDELDDINNLSPFAVGGCDTSGNQISYTDGTTLSLMFKGELGFNDVTDDITDNFYGVVSEYDTANGNSNFSHFKNGVKQDFDVDFTVNTDGQLVQTGDYWTDSSKTDGDADLDDIFSIPTVDSLSKEQRNNPKSLYDEVKHFITANVTMYVGVTKCGSTSASITFDHYMKVKFTSAPTFVNSAGADGYEPLTFDLEVLVEPGDIVDVTN